LSERKKDNRGGDVKKLIFALLLLLVFTISAYAQMGSDMTGGQKGEMSRQSMIGEGQSMMNYPMVRQIQGHGMRQGYEMAGQGMAKDRVGRHNPWFRYGVSLILYHADELELSDEQREQLDDMRRKYSKDIIRLSADSKIAEIDLEALLKEPEANLQQVKEALKKVESAKTEIRYLRIEALFEARKILTSEQRSSLKKLMWTYGSTRLRGISGSSESREEQEETPEEEVPETDTYGH
jgi:Spy/CpxP family protein refolding chaperone